MVLSTALSSQPHWLVQGAPLGWPERYQTVVETAGIVAVLVPAGGEVEGVLVIDLLEEAAAIVAHDLDGDADLAQRLLDEGRPQRDVFAPGRGQQF